MDHASGGRGPFRRILFCTDFSENADYAFGFALEQALRCPEAVLYILHVIPEPDAQFWKSYIYEVDGVDNKARRDIDARVEAAYKSRLPPSVGHAHRTTTRIARNPRLKPTHLKFSCLDQAWSASPRQRRFGDGLRHYWHVRRSLGSGNRVLDLPRGREMR